MIRQINGLAAMAVGSKEVYVRDGRGDFARLFVGGSDVELTIEEMRHLSLCLADAADRAALRPHGEPEQGDTQ